MKKVLKVVFWALVLAVFPASAQHSHNHAQIKQTQITEIFSKGVIEAIELESKKVTITHEAIKALSWPAMTMRFTFENESLIQNLKIKDNVEFGFVQQGKISLLKSIKKI
jgi:Cu(I)/Ag(I) efflux system protein CusF